MKTAPIKRSKALTAPKSRTSSRLTAMLGKYEQGLKKGQLISSRIKAYTDWFFKNSLLTHFNIEEEFVFPLLGNEHELVKKALTDHRRLKRLLEDTTDIEKSSKSA
jgi:hemerythrin superfamily protein